MAVSGANFGVAETGTVCIVESEGNGRMCLTLPEVLISVMGMEKVIPSWQDFEVFLQLLPRSSTGERMNPYTSFWTGVSAGDGPQEFHLVLLDNGRTRVLDDPVGRQALHCIRCSACLNICPVYERTGGHAYQSVYPGPIGAILTPQLAGVETPVAALCLVALRRLLRGLPGQDQHPRGAGPPARPGRPSSRGRTGSARRVDPERLAMQVMARRLRQPARYEAAQRSARRGQGRSSATARSRSCPARWRAGRRCATCRRAAQTFREWWRARESPAMASPRRDPRPHPRGAAPTSRDERRRATCRSRATTGAATIGPRAELVELFARPRRRIQRARPRVAAAALGRRHRAMPAPQRGSDARGPDRPARRLAAGRGRAGARRAAVSATSSTASTAS